MNTKVVTATPETLLPQVWDLISRKHIHCVPVIDFRKKLVGIVSKEDILAKLFPEVEDNQDRFDDSDEEIELKVEKLKKMTVEKIMNRRVFFTRGESNIMRALSRMIVRNVRQLPVIDESEKVVGMISKNDIFKKLFKGKM